MKCKIFTGKWYDAMDAFNAWAKGKALTREVLIHTLPNLSKLAVEDPEIIIVVYHPEDPEWDKTEPEATIPVQNVPVPQYKIEEIKVTQ